MEYLAYSPRPWRRAVLAAVLLASAPAMAAPALLRPWPAKLATPALALTAMDGKQWDLAALRGKVVLLNFWATWCGPCVEEAPALNRLATDPALQDRLVVLGVNYRESDSAISRFASAQGLRYPLAQDLTGAHFKRWSTGVMPTTVLIDRSGRARWRVMGAFDEHDAAFRRALDGLLHD